MKLEVIADTPCPRWHADHVGLRCLCTYIGEGTWWIENRCEECVIMLGTNSFELYASRRYVADAQPCCSVLNLLRSWSYT